MIRALWLYLLAVPAFASEPPPLDFFVGRYQAVGRVPDSSRTYHGRVEMAARGDHLRWIRIVGDRRVRGTARIEPSLCEGIPVLRVRYEDRGVEHEISYLIHVDLDNYPRLSGRVHRRDGKTGEAGLEALFSLQE